LPSLGRDIDAGAMTPFAWMRERAKGLSPTMAGPLGPADKGTILATVKLPDYANAALEGFGSMWVTVGSYQSTALVRIDLGTNAITDVISLGKPVLGSPGELAISPGAVWVPRVLRERSRPHRSGDGHDRRSDPSRNVTFGHDLCVRLGLGGARGGG